MGMKVIVCGSRNWTDPEPIRRELGLLPYAWQQRLKETPPPGVRGSDFDLKNYVEKIVVRQALIIHGDNGRVDEEGRAIKGADKIAGQIAREMGFTVVPVPAEWTKYRKSAGPRRNATMLAMLLDGGGEKLVLAFHEDLEQSKGTKDMIRRALDAGIPVKIIPVQPISGGKL